MKNITNDRVTEYTDSLFVPISTAFDNLRKWAEEDNIPIIQRETEGLLVSLLKMNNPKRILEVGTAIGYSAGVMAMTCPKASILTLEKNQLMYEKALANIKELNLESNIEVCQCDAKEMLNALKLEVKENKRSPFDFVFIDAAKSHYTKFWLQIIQMVKKGAVIVCDNVLQRGMTADESYDTYDKHRTNIRKMREFLEYISSLPKVHTTILAVGDGVSISYIERDSEE
ncbi:MAG: O-methyltransferase [Anaerovoracaceae bacterium]